MINPNPHARESFFQQAQANIKQQLLEGCEKEFFRDVEILTADPATILSTIDEALGKLGLCVSIEVTGGVAPQVEVETEWDASVFVFETPVLNRGDKFDGKTMDIVVDAVLRACCGMTYFVPKSVEILALEGYAACEVKGTTNIILKQQPCLKCAEKES